MQALKFTHTKYVLYKFKRIANLIICVITIYMLIKHNNLFFFYFKYFAMAIIKYKLGVVVFRLKLKNFIQKILNKLNFNFS